MKRVLKSFKDLFVCENPAKRHLLYVALMLLPCIAGVFAGYIDKDTPIRVMIVLAGILLFLLALSIVPFIYMLGFGMEFYELRLKGEAGFPKLNKDMWAKGLKVFPIGFVWTVYAVIFCSIFVFFPFFICITSAITLHNNPIAIVCTILLCILIVILACLTLCILAPFTQYIYINFVKDYQYKAKYFNPLILIDYIRKSFKDTMLVFLKMSVAGIVVGFATSIISFLLMLFVLPFLTFIVALFAGGDTSSDAFVYSPLMIISAIPISTLALIQNYVTSIIGFAASDMYVEVYKNKIEPFETV